jgi:Trp operon repressor
MPGNIHKIDLSANLGSIATMTRGSVPVQHKAVAFDYAINSL